MNQPPIQEQQAAVKCITEINKLLDESSFILQRDPITEKIGIRSLKTRLFYELNED